MKPPKASFVVPVYNGIAFLATALKSALEQTERNIEVVVVDDKSTDDSAAIISYLAEQDKRIVPVYLSKNKGRSAARNVGIEAARGEIILILDADDVAYPGRVRETLKAFKKNPGASLLYGSFHVMNSLGEVEGVIESKPFDWQRLLETKMTFIGHSTMAFKRSMYEVVRYSNGPYCKNAIDDWKFQVDAYKAGFKFINSPQLMAQYRFIPKKRDEAEILKLKEAALS